jgi:hypothetical protein
MIGRVAARGDRDLAPAAVFNVIESPLTAEDRALEREAAGAGEPARATVAVAALAAVAAPGEGPAVALAVEELAPSVACRGARAGVPRPTANATPAIATATATARTTLTIRPERPRGFTGLGTTGAGGGARSGPGANGFAPVDGPAGDG